MELTTTPSMEGRKIIRYCGVVAGEAVLGANILKDMFASLRDIVGSQLGMWRSLLCIFCVIAMSTFSAYGQAQQPSVQQGREAKVKDSFQDGGFDRGSSAIKPEFYRKLDALCDASKEIELEVIIVFGYTDETDGKLMSIELAQHRANAIKSFLVYRGVEANRIHVEGRQLERSSGLSGRGAEIEIIGIKK
jgi:hypothetical protein